MAELPPALEAAIREAPDDPEGYRVAGDWLMGEGDPQGELVALAFGPQTEAVTARMAVLQRALPPFDVTAPWSPVALEWQWGFVRAVQVTGGLAADEADLVRRVLRAPACRLVRRLVVSRASRKMIAAIVECADVLGALRAFVLGVEKGAAIGAVDLGAVWRAAVRLDRVALHVGELVGAIEGERLVELVVSNTRYGAEIIGRSTLPALQTLRVSSEATVVVDGSWLDPQRLPALRRLWIDHREPMDVDGWRELAIARQLELFDLVTYRQGADLVRRTIVDRVPIGAPAALVVTGAPAERGLVGQRFEMVGHRSTVIGRDPRCDVRLVGADVGARHARMTREASWSIEAIEGTYVNGWSVGRMALRSGDDIGIGGMVVRFLQGDVGMLEADLRRRYGL